MEENEWKYIRYSDYDCYRKKIDNKEEYNKAFYLIAIMKNKYGKDNVKVKELQSNGICVYIIVEVYIQ